MCKRDGHLKKDCPEDFKKVKLDPLPPATPEFLDVLGQVCEQCYSECDGCLVGQQCVSVLSISGSQGLRIKFRCSAATSEIIFFVPVVAITFSQLYCYYYQG